ncbi:MAG: DMT family transporter [Acidobacteria bacterium]|nr:MAG: DMT family transporter [Acidobacteriota bacterium]
MTAPLTNIGSRPAAYGPAEWGMTITLGIIWGSAFLWIAIAVEAFSPGVVAFGRVALGAAALAAFPRARKRIRRDDWGRIFLIAIVGNAGPALLFAAAETELDSAVAGMVTSVTPVMSLIIAALILKKLPGRSQVLGIGIGLVGIVILTTPSLVGAHATPWAIGFVLLATVGYGVMSNVVVPLQQEYGGPTVVLWALVVSAIVLAPLAAISSSPSDFKMSSLVALVVLGVVGTGIVRALATTLAGRVGGPRMTTATYQIPVVAIILGVVFRGEVIAPIAIVGVVVVLSGAYLATRAVAAIAR